MTGFDFNFTVTQLSQVMPGIKDAEDWFTALSNLLPTFEITNAKRIAMFLAMTGHESGNFSVLIEDLNYSAAGLAATWPSEFKTNNPDDYARQPEKIANLVYANRMGNGNTASGDGWNFRGRGLIQLTGKENYSVCSTSIYGDARLLSTPELLLTMDGAIASACWFWNLHNLNPLSDDGNIKQVRLIANGGYIGLADCETRYAKALSVFGIDGIIS
jgi:putative chitinase